MPTQPPERRLVTESALDTFDTNLPTRLSDEFDGRGSAAAAEAAAKDYAGTLAYGSELEVTDATVAALANDPASDLGTHLGSTYETVEGAAASYVASNTIRRLVTSRNVETTLADGDALIPLPTPSLLTDFHRTPIGETPAGWTKQWADGEWSAIDSPDCHGGKALYVGTKDGDSGLSVMDDITAAYADVEIVFRHWALEPAGMPRLVFRASGPASGEDRCAFVAHVDGIRNELRVARHWNGTFAGWGVPFPYDGDEWITLRARIHGDHLSVRAWRDGEPEPEAWMYSREMGFPPSANTPLSEPGWAGVYSPDLNASVNASVDWLGIAVDGGRAPMPEVI